MYLAPEWLAFEEAIGFRVKISGKDINDIRSKVAAQRAAVPLPPASETLDINDEQLDGFKVRVYKPKEITGRIPLTIFIHGGGFVVGDLESEELTCRLIADTAPSVVVSVDYRLAPEHPWPSSLKDCVAAVDWATKHFADSKDVDASTLIVSGGSAGGLLSLSTTIQLLEKGVKVHGVAALVPITIGETAVPSHLKSGYKSIEENAEAPIADTPGLRQLLEANGADDNDPNYSVLLNPTLKKFPRTYVVTCGADPLRDDGTLLVNALKDAGVEVKHDNYPGFPHYFWSVPVIPETNKFRTNLTSGFKFILS